MDGRLSKENARQLTERIQESLEVSYELLVQAYEGGAWYVLGYKSWDAYCAAEFTRERMLTPAREQRREICGQLAEAGLSLREIESATGISKDTVSRELKRSITVADATEDDLDDEIVEAELVVEPSRYRPDPRDVAAAEEEYRVTAARKTMRRSLSEIKRVVKALEELDPRDLVEAPERMRWSDALNKYSYALAKLDREIGSAKQW